MNFTPRIMADNFFRRSGIVIVNPSAATGFPATNLYDGIDWLPYKPDTTSVKKLVVDLGSAKAPDAWGAIGHTFGDETVTVTLQHSDTGTGGPFTNLDVISPSDNRDFMRSLDGTESHQYWAIDMDSIDSTDLVVGELMIGEAVSFPFGIQWSGFDPRAETPMTTDQRNSAGHIIGSQFDYSARNQAWSVVLLDDSFLTDLTEFTGWRWYWDNFGRVSKPAFHLWNADETSNDFQFDAIWGKTTGFTEAMQSAIADGYRDFNITVVGRVSGTEL